MNYYKIRIDSNSMTEVKNFLEQFHQEYLYSQEGVKVDNPHVHGYFSTIKNEAAIRSAIRKKYGAGNGVYSLGHLSEQYPIAYLAYCIKERTYIHNLKPDIMFKAIEFDLVVKSEIKAKKEARKTILQKIEETLDKDALAVYAGSREERKEHEVYRREHNLPDYLDGYIAQAVVDYYKNTGTLVREFAMVSQVQTLMLKYGDDYRNYMVDLLSFAAKKDLRPKYFGP